MEKKTLNFIRNILGIIIYTFLLTGITYYASTTQKERVQERLTKPVANTLYTIATTLTSIREQLFLDRFFINNSTNQDGLVFHTEDKLKNKFLLTAYSNANSEIIIDLIDLEFGASLKKWRPDLKKISKMSYLEGKTTRFLKGSMLYAVHPIMLKDSSVVFNTSHSLVKIDKKGEILWVRNDYEAHHSIEMDESGHLWIASRYHEAQNKDFFSELGERYYKKQFMDDLIMKVEPNNGDIIFEKSFLDILKENNMMNLFYFSGEISHDPIHINDVQPALNDSKYWNKGDLLISVRRLSTVFLYRPSENRIVWYKKGPWLNQHDPNFLDNNKISVFGNQVIFGTASKYLKKPFTRNSVFVYDFSNDKTYEPYKKMILKDNYFTRGQGRSKILKNGDVFMEITNDGLVVIGDTINKKITFSKRINPNKVSYLGWTRLIEN